MRKRSRYRPKGVRLDVVGWVIEGMKPVTAAAKDEILTLRIRNHVALDALRTGEGTKEDVDVVIAALNMTEALARLRIGAELSEQIRAGQDALYAMAQRGLRLGRFVFTGQELQAINLAMQIHDAQLDVCTIAELEKALKIVQDELRSKRTRVIQAVED
jgi:hypothetical protein